MPDYLWESTVACGVEVGDWRGAIGAVGGLLVAAGCMDERYVLAMCRAVEVKGPYIVVAPGIALPHASPDDGARQVGLAAVRLRTPVSFGHQSNDPVDLLFCLCSPDFHSHITALVGLTGLLENKEALGQVRAATDAGAMYRVLAANLL
jgi:mannitol/fructose-specific phosphotransferase system IIA component (Ntr-type)